MISASAAEDKNALLRVVPKHRERNGYGHDDTMALYITSRISSVAAAELPKWSFRVPAGGLFFWVKLPRGDSREFAQIALRHRVAVLPGPVMSAAGQHSEFLRVPFLAEPETLRIAVRRLGFAWREYESAGRHSARQHLAIV